MRRPRGRFDFNAKSDASTEEHWRGFHASGARKCLSFHNFLLPLVHFSRARHSEVIFINRRSRARVRRVLDPAVANGILTAHWPYAQREGGQMTHMTLCPIAIAVGCKKCAAVSICPLKGVIGDYKKPEDAPPKPSDKAADAPRDK